MVGIKKKRLLLKIVVAFKVNGLVTFTNAIINESESFVYR